MKKAYGLLPSVELGLSLLMLFVSRQVLGEGEVATVLTWVGVAGILGAFAWRALERARASEAARPVETALLAAYGGILIAVGLYGLTTDWGLQTLGLDVDEPGGLAGVLFVLWPAVFAVSLSALVFMELAYAGMPLAEAVEGRRVRSAALDGLTIALALVFAVSVNYVAANQDVRADLSYFKTTHPSHATLERVKALTEPIEVVLFYPEVNDVLEEVRPYFEELAAASDKLTVRVTDHALEPELVRKHRIRDNGFVLLLRGEGEGQQAESFEVGKDLESARQRLRTLDGHFQESFMRLTTRRRELHLTTGHDERSRTGVEGDTVRDHIREIEAALQRSNIATRPLGMAQGLANRVPEGAPAVAVLGPRSPLLPEEARSLLRYVQGGGRLVVLVDPDVDHGLDPLLHGLGVKLEEGVLTSDREFIRRDFTPSDRSIVRTSQFSSHPTVTLASRNASQLAMVFIRGGALSRYEADDVTEGVHVVFPVKSGQMWLDLDGDYQRGEDEPLRQYNMMAAITVPVEGGDEGRAVIIADGDFVTDQVIRNPGNALVFGDVMQWLLGEEHVVTDTESEEDRLIEHTTEEDKLWFWGTSFGVPLPIFGFGVFVAMRRRRRKKSRPERRYAGQGAKDRAEAPAAGGAAAAAPQDAAGVGAEGSAQAAPGDAGGDAPADQAAAGADHDEAEEEEPA